jgi:hypothetical protein
MSTSRISLLFVVAVVLGCSPTVSGGGTQDAATDAPPAQDVVADAPPAQDAVVDAPTTRDTGADALSSGCAAFVDHYRRCGGPACQIETATEFCRALRSDVSDRLGTCATAERCSSDGPLGSVCVVRALMGVEPTTAQRAFARTVCRLCPVIATTGPGPTPTPAQCEMSFFTGGFGSSLLPFGDALVTEIDRCTAGVMASPDPLQCLGGVERCLTPSLDAIRDRCGMRM